jgi:hypothetical protein
MEGSAREGRYQRVRRRGYGRDATERSRESGAVWKQNGRDEGATNISQISLKCGTKTYG